MGATLTFYLIHGLLIALVAVFVRYLPVESRLYQLGQVIWRGFEQIARQPVRAGALLSLWCLFLLTFIYLLIDPFPLLNDEFGNLLAADTFAHGRLVNPSHPLWPFFESSHIVVHPIYVSKYPPAQALLLLIGRLLVNFPMAGVWLGYGMATLAIWWALRAIASPAAALLGGMAIGAHWHLLPLFGEMYWGGPVSMLGGALVVGSWFHLRQLPAPAGLQYGVIMGLGACLLAISRPFEGLATALVPAFLLLGSRRWSVIAATGVVVGLGGLLLMTYNYQITGQPTKLPYTLYYDQYEVSRPLLIQQPGKNPVIRRPEMKQVHDYETQVYFKRRTSLRSYLGALVQKAKIYGGILFGIAYWLPLLYWLFRRKEPLGQNALDLTLLAMLVLPILAFAITSFETPHYVSPVIVVLAGIVTRGFSYLPHYLRVGLLLPSLCVAHTLFVFLGYDFLIRMSGPMLWRPIHQQELTEDGGRHLILVDYDPNHVATIWDFVYNGADIDSQSVVWAADRGDSLNRAILDYYPERSVWRIEPDTRPHHRILLRRPRKNIQQAYLPNQRAITQD
ncbi:hypothetical protein HNV11_04385 [Spirosoma taeanense]|uniref:Glycosyltransferase RgtA/B/C/D-like domain-containing protein n=1 Tax=Spirosoma taeanense TaxID=2735870 RepID=A0A6M5Y1U1_9BACT|nr:hypothetical protein [Spirosoma taeanense]QJW88667.1 hypothetical protein HNV11_04385 [Spirosoma taeanense]